MDNTKNTQIKDDLDEAPYVNEGTDSDTQKINIGTRMITEVWALQLSVPFGCGVTGLRDMTDMQKPVKTETNDS